MRRGRTRIPFTYEYFAGTMLPLGLDTCTPWHRPPGQVCSKCKCTPPGLDTLRYSTTSGYSTNGAQNDIKSASYLSTVKSIPAYNPATSEP